MTSADLLALVRDEGLPTVPCRRDCSTYFPGHAMHFIHAGRLASTPWGWRDSVVTQVQGQALAFEYVDPSVSAPGAGVVWRHRPWPAAVVVGGLVRVHERYWAVGSSAGWFSVVVVRGVGAVPEPEDVERWWREHPEAGAPGRAAVVDLGTGVAVPVDHVDPWAEGSASDDR